MARNGSIGRWLVNRTNPEYIDYFSRVSSISPICAQVLVNRGVKTPEQLTAFLNPDPGKLSDPFDLPGLKRAVERIKEARQRGERVLIHGDYDADGVSATAIMVEALRTLGIDVHYFIPHRLNHGYGFGMPGIEKAKELGAKLIITVDCGITSFEAVALANASGMEVIITDHHEPVRRNSEVSQQSIENRIQAPEDGVQKADIVLPEAFAIVNPKISDALSGSAHLSGAGVAFKIVQGLFGNESDIVYKVLDIAALGTGADVVPVLDDNRIILKEGIKLIQSGERIGIKALKEAAGIRPEFFRTSLLYYVLVPRINAAGRIADATDVVRLLTTHSEGEAETLARWLHGLNAKRQEIEEAVFQEALQMLEKADARGPIVLASAGWHLGVVGIVAARLAERFYRPSVVLSIENGIAKGSARSIPAFDLHSGLAQCGELLKRFGGHKQAAGLALPTENIEQLRAMLSRVVDNTLSEDDFFPVLNIDAAVNIADISVELIDELARLEPFGYGNDEPLLGARGLEVIQPKIVGKNHLKMRLRQGGRRVDSIGFDFGDLLPLVEENSHIDAAFVPAINEWDGGRFIQLNLKAIRPTQ